MAMKSLKNFGNAVGKATYQTAKNAAIKEIKQIPVANEAYQMASAVAKETKKQKQKQKRKKAKAAKPANAPIVQVQALPSSIAITITQPDSQITNFVRGGDNISRLSLTQQVGPLTLNSADYGQIDFPTNPRVFRQWVYDFAGLEAKFFGALAQKAIGYQNINFTSCTIHWAPTQPIGTTLGNVGMSVYTDVTRPLTDNWTDFTSIRGAKTGQIANQLSMDLLPYLREKYNNAGYRIAYMPQRLTTGAFDLAESSAATQIAPVSFLLGTEGVDGAFGIDAQIGTLVMTVTAELSVIVQPSLDSMAAIAGEFHTEIEHDLSSSSVIMPGTPIFWTTNRVLLFQAYGERRYNIDFTATIDPTTPVIFGTFLQLFNINDVLVPPTHIFDTATGVTSDGRSFYHLNATITLNRGWYLRFANVNWIGKISVDLEPLKGASTSLLKKFD